MLKNFVDFKRGGNPIAQFERNSYIRYLGSWFACHMRVLARKPFNESSFGHPTQSLRNFYLRGRYLRVRLARV